jgi:hypothetical protein
VLKRVRFWSASILVAILCTVNSNGDDGCGSLVLRQLFPIWHRDTVRPINVCHDQPDLISSVTADWRVPVTYHHEGPGNYGKSYLNDALFWDRATGLATFASTPAA